MIFRQGEAGRVFWLPDPDPLRHADSPDHVLGGVRSVLWHHVQVGLTVIMMIMMIVMMIAGGSTSPSDSFRTSSKWTEGSTGEFYSTLFFELRKNESFLVRVEPTQLAFVILGASMAAIGLMILVSSFLATGATRTEVRH